MPAETCQNAETPICNELHNPLSISNDAQIVDPQRGTQNLVPKGVSVRVRPPAPSLIINGLSHPLGVGFDTPSGVDIRPVYGPGKVRRFGRSLSGCAVPVNRLDLPSGFWVTLTLHSERTSFNRGQLRPPDDPSSVTAVKYGRHRFVRLEHYTSGQNCLQYFRSSSK